MKYLKRFNESSDYNLENLNSLVLDFIDDYQLSLKSEYLMQKIYAGNGIELSVGKDHILEQDAYVITISGANFLNYGYSKESCFKDEELNKMFKDIEELGKVILKSPCVAYGHFKTHGRNKFSIVFFTKNLSKKFNLDDMYGSDIIKEYKGGFMHTDTISHQNCFRVYNKDDRMNGMYAILGYYDGWFYENELVAVAKGSHYNSFNKIWKDTIERLKIIPYRKIRVNYKITVPEFMDILIKELNGYEIPKEI